MSKVREKCSSFIAPSQSVLHDPWFMMEIRQGFCNVWSHCEFEEECQRKSSLWWLFFILFQHPNSLYLPLTFPQSSDESQAFSYLQAIWKVAAHTLCNVQNPGDLILILSLQFPFLLMLVDLPRVLQSGAIKCLGGLQCRLKNKLSCYLQFRRHCWVSGLSHQQWRSKIYGKINTWEFQKFILALIHTFSKNAGQVFSIMYW